MALARGGASRRILEQARAAAEGVDRYVDLALRLRAVRADFAEDVPIDYPFVVAGVECVTAAAGRLGVPVRSLEIGASSKIPDGAAFDGGVFRAKALLEAGGRWDTLRKAWAPAPPEQWHTIDLIQSQHKLVRDFAAWLQRYKERRRRPVGRRRDIRTMNAYGNRGSGKTFVGLLLLLALALDVPDGVYWIVVENRPAATRDVWQAFEDLQPWAKYRGQPDYFWRLPNGSRIYYKSADEPKSLKAGRVDGLLINEAAKLPSTVYGYATARTKERGGISILATNPPTPDAPRGVWVYRLFEKERQAEAKGEWFPCRSYQLNSDDNALIDRSADEDVNQLIRAVAPELAAADVEGLMALPGQRILFEFDSVRHVRDLPDLRDITVEFTRRKYGRGFPYVAGLDFQQNPYIIASFWKIYGTHDNPILWGVSDFTTQGSEDDFLDDLLEQGIQIGEAEFEPIEPGTVLWIGDASAAWQDSKTRGQQAVVMPKSYDFWRRRGLIIIPPTEKKSPESRYAANPRPVAMTLGLMNHWLKHERLFLSPLCARLVEAFAESQAVVSRKGSGAVSEWKYAHAIDTARYVRWWVQPPTKRGPAAPGFRMPGALSLPGR